MHKNTFTLIVFSLLYIGIFWLDGFIWVGISLIIMWIYLSFLYLLFAGWKKLWNRDFITFSVNSVYKFLYWVAIMITIIFWFLGSFTYYHNHISPAILSSYTLSDWEKTLVFQTMSHIGSQNFYSKIINQIIHYKSLGYVYFYEWVRPWSQENSQAFSEAIGVQFDENTYKSLSKLYWLEFQDQNEFLGLVNDEDYNIDISIDDIMEQYHQSSHPKDLLKSVIDWPIDVEQLVQQQIWNLNPKALLIFQYINKSFINAILKSKSTQQTLQDKLANQALFDVILHQRDKFIAQAILSTDEKKIFLTYGELHFQWIFDILKTHNPKWQIIEINSFYPLK